MSHLLTAAPQPGPEQCGDLHGAFCKKSPRKILLLPSFLVFSELYFQRYSNMPCFPAVQMEYNLREELIPYEYPLKSSKEGSLPLNLSRVELAHRRWEIAELDRVRSGVGEG